MPELVIGSRSIPYEVRRSLKAGRKRIEVSPRGVEVIVPYHTSSQDVERFVQRKRRWLHDKTIEVQEEIERLRAETPQGFHSGAKILFRGRYLRLRVSTGKVEKPTLKYRTAFHVQLPRDFSNGQQEPVVRSLVEEWLENRLAEDAWEVVRRRGTPHGLEPRSVQVRDQRTLWGSCGRDGVVRIDSKLVRVPRPVFEYVMVHELCHLRHRDHSTAFWDLVKRILPDYEERKAWLEQHEVEVG